MSSQRLSENASSHVSTPQASNSSPSHDKTAPQSSKNAAFTATKPTTRGAFLRLGFLFLGLLCIILVVLNFIFSMATTARWDLTADKQFTLSPATVSLLDSLDSQIRIKVFLTPNLPAPDNTLSQRAKDLLAEFEAKAHGKLAFEIIAPESKTDEEIAKGFGLRKVAVSQRDESQRTLRLVFKGMTVIYKDTAETIPELRAQDNLEYLIAKSIVNLTAPEKKNIGILTDFGGLAQSPILIESMQEVFAEVFGKRLDVVGTTVTKACQLSVDSLSALLLLNLDTALTPCAQYAIEQAVMSGTSLAILQSPTQGDYRQPDQPRINLDTQINALLENTGLSLPQTLLLDRAHNLTGTQFTEDDALAVSLPALPIITNIDKSHPITQNLTALVLPFSGTIAVDKAKIAPEATLSILAQSDADAVTRPSGGDIAVDALQTPRENETLGPHTVAVALQTPLQSRFKSHLPDGADRSKFRESTHNARFFVVPNGEFLFTNKITGYTDAFAKFGIHLFVNATEWLVQDEALMAIRNRNLPQMVQKPDPETQNRLILINVVGVPALVLVLMGLLRLHRRWRVRRIQKDYANATPASKL